MDVGFMVFCVTFLLFLIFMAVEVLNGYDVESVDECGLCGEQPVYMSGVCLDCFHVEFGLDAQR